MTAIKISGIKTQRTKGRVYRYHRRTGVRIDIDPDAFPVEFLSRVRELDALAEGSLAPQVQSAAATLSASCSMRGSSRRNGPR
jgi:hypothetical protein